MIHVFRLVMFLWCVGFSLFDFHNGSDGWGGFMAGLAFMWFCWILIGVGEDL